MRHITLAPLALLAALLPACSSSESTSDCPTGFPPTSCQDGVLFQVDGCGRRLDTGTTCECGCASDGHACADCTCTPDCAGRECGPDPVCNQSCGSCGPDETCRSGACAPSCIKDCAGRVCGPDPVCNQSCGTCDDGFDCDNGDCLPVCVPDCSSRECGPDPICGQSCGTCDGGASCENGSCVTLCTPDCTGRNCGLDPLCNQSCGFCGPEQACAATGRCETVSGWRQTWGDEFDGPSTPGDPCYDNAQTPPMCLDRYWSRTACPADVLPNLANLDKCVWSVYDIYNWMDWGKPWGSGMNNLDPREVVVTGGELRLSAHTAPQDGQPWDCGNPLPNDYLSKHCLIRAGAVMSQGWNDSAVTQGFQQLYGRFEVRAILPAGPGAWPAHWLLPQQGGWPEAGEIDIMEATWNDPTRAAGNFHGGTYDGDVRTHYSPGDFGHDPLDARFTSSWHVYAAEWQQDEIRFFIDDLEIGRVHAGQLVDATVIGANDPSKVGQSAGTLPLDVPATAFFWILNTSVVPNGGLQQNLANFVPLDHRIDYVRVYERCVGGDPGCTVDRPSSRVVTLSPTMSKAWWSAQDHITIVGDFDGDMRADVLLQARSLGTPSRLLLADDRGAFRAGIDVDSLYGMIDVRWAGDLREAEVGDFDGNGADDLLLRGLTDEDETLLLLADRQGGFQHYVDVTDSFGMSKTSWAASGSRVSVADFDGDGADDLLLQALTDSGATRLLIADGQGGFESARDVTSSSGLTPAHWGHVNHQLVVADFNGDGAADVLLQGRDAVRPTVLALADENGAFQTATDLTDSNGMTAARWADEFRAVAAGDFDGDGDADVVLQSRAAGQASYLLVSDGSGVLEPPVDVTSAFGMSQSMWSAESHVVLIGDFDGDGRSDVLLASHVSGARSYLLRGAASGGFQGVTDVTDRGVMSAELWLTHDWHPGDYDGDGRVDILLQARDAQRDTYLIRLGP